MLHRQISVLWFCLSLFLWVQHLQCNFWSKYANLLYVSNKQFKKLSDHGSIINLYMGINKKHLYSNIPQSFYADFMFETVIYNTYGSFICTSENSCEYFDYGKHVYYIIYFQGYEKSSKYYFDWYYFNEMKLFLGIYSVRHGALKNTIQAKYLRYETPVQYSKFDGKNSNISCQS